MNRLEKSKPAPNADEVLRRMLAMPPDPKKLKPKRKKRTT